MRVVDANEILDVHVKRFAEIDSAGHMVHLDNPDGLADQILPFLYSKGVLSMFRAGNR